MAVYFVAPLVKFLNLFGRQGGRAVPDTRGKILVVDDKACIRSAMSIVLGEIGYDVRTAEDGCSALREIRQKSPEILLSDLNMPGMSGFELLTVVRRRFPEILVIAMSGAFSGSEVPSGIPADAFYQKGSSTSALLQIIRTPPEMKRPLLQPWLAGAPLWIHRNGNDLSGKKPVSITCPECLRAFSQVLDGHGSLMREVDCIHCGNSIQYAIAEPSSQTRSQSSQVEAGAPVLTQKALIFSN